MKNKKYSPPELEIIQFNLTSNILTGSIEHGQTSSAGGDLTDPVDDNPLDWGGF